MLNQCHGRGRHRVREMKARLLRCRDHSLISQAERPSDTQTVLAKCTQVIRRSS
jgi:hypothetical protein